jgi:hypothetical protein
MKRKAKSGPSPKGWLAGKAYTASCSGTVLGLAKKNFHVIVLEKVPALREIGAGIQLALDPPNRRGPALIIAENDHTSRLLRRL